MHCNVWEWKDSLFLETFVKETRPSPNALFSFLYSSQKKSLSPNVWFLFYIFARTQLPKLDSLVLSEFCLSKGSQVSPTDVDQSLISQKSSFSVWHFYDFRTLALPAPVLRWAITLQKRLTQVAIGHSCNVCIETLNDEYCANIYVFL